MAKILVVDDEPELRSQLEWAACGEDNGQEVVSAESGSQAIQLIQQQDFDAIVTDLKMETDDAGLTVLKAAKEKDIYTQVIVVTAYGTPEVSVETMRLGAFDYLERNAPGTETLAMIRSKITLALEFRKAKLAERKSQL
jgi:DNA-binding NtrC family response regulator